MAEKPTSSLRKLEDAAIRLNQLTDKGSEQVRRLEGMLNELSIGVTVAVQFCETPKRSLEYRRRTDRSYHIAVVSHIPYEEVKSWEQCSREIKLQAINALPELIEKLTLTIEAKISEAVEALARLSQILSHKDQGGSSDGRG